MVSGHKTSNKAPGRLNRRRVVGSRRKCRINRQPERSRDSAVDQKRVLTDTDVNPHSFHTVSFRGGHGHTGEPQAR
jgi:hypothetical protein